MVRVECALSLSRIPLSDAFNVRFIAEMSDAESVVVESKPKDPSANPKPQSSELVDEELSLFKGYLETKLEAQGKLYEGQSKIQRSASEFKFSNRKQFEVNAKLESLFSARIKASADNPSQVNIPTILDKTVEKILYLDSIFLNIVAVPVLASPLPLKAMLWCIQKKA